MAEACQNNIKKIVLFSNKIYIFLNNKLVSCDTILPLALEIKNKAPKVKIIFFVLDYNTFIEIKKNTTLFNIINKIGSIELIGWKNFKKYTFINKLLKLLNLFKIIINLSCSKNRIIHFRYLEIFPWNIIYYLNKKNTILFESDCWGYKEKVTEIFYNFRTDKEKSDLLNNYGMLAYFGSKWPQLSHAKVNKKRIFNLSSTREFSCWRDETKKELNNILEKKPAWSISKNNGILFILGWLGHSHMYDKNVKGEELFSETIDILLYETNLNIILKPHATTDMTKIDFIINELYKKRLFNKNRIFIEYNHIAVLSGFFNVTISNYPSLTMEDAKIAGSNVIEYSDYSNIAKKLCNNSSLYKEYVHYYIKTSCYNRYE